MNRKKLTRNLLAGTSALILGSLASTAANAAALDASADRTANAGYTLGTAGDTVDAGVTIKHGGTSSADLIRIKTNSGDLTVLNTGKVSAISAGAHEAIGTTGANTGFDLKVNATGTITGNGANSAMVIDLDHNIGSITNVGTIQSSANNGEVINIANGLAISGNITNGDGSSAATLQAHGTGSAIDVAGTFTGSIINKATSLIASAGNSSAGVIDVNGAITGSISNAGTIKTNAGGIAIDVGANITLGITNSSGGAITATTGDAISVSGGDLSASAGLNNAGSITATTGKAIDLSGGSIFTVTNSGTIQSAVGIAIDIAANEKINTLTNSGLITDTGAGDAINFIGASSGTINNSGTISTGGAGIAIDLNGAYTGTWTNSGTITGLGSSDSAVIQIDGHVTGGITNTGTISQTAATADSAIGVADGNDLDITNTAGLITSAGTIVTLDIEGETDGFISNTGTISGTNSGGAIDVGTLLNYVAGNDGDIINTGGLITAGTSSTMDTVILADIDGTITNTGTISSTATGAISAIAANFVVDSTAAASSVVINNSGLITSAGTTDTIDFGDIDGAATIINSGTISNTSSGSVLEMSGETTSAITVTHTGAITAANATTAAIVGGGGDDVLNWNHGTITGTINLGSETGDTINVGDASTDSISTGGAVSGISQIQIKQGTFGIGHAVTFTNATEGDEDFIVDSGATANVTASVTLEAGDIDVNGTLKVADGITLSTNATTTSAIDVAADGVVRFIVTNNGTTTAYAKIDNETNAAGDFTFATATSTQKQVYIDVTGTTNSIPAGTLDDIIKSDALNIAGTAVSSSNYTSIGCQDNSYVLTCAVASTSESTGLDITLTRTNAYNTTSTVSHVSAVGSALETIANSGDSALDTIVATLDAKTTAAQVENALETLTPKVDGSTMVAVSNATDAALATASDRLASLRMGSQGIATGSSFQNSAVWLQGFGSSVDQGDRKGVRGYQSDTYGFAIGADTQVADKVRLGASFSYANSDVDSFRGTNDVDSYQGTVYGDYDEGEWYVEGLLALSFNDFETSRTLFDSSIARGDADGISYSGKVGAGYRVPLEGGLNVTPVGSLQYTFIDNDGYTETGSNGNLTVDPDDNNIFETGLGVKLDYPIVDAGVTYVPQLKVQWLYDIIGDEVESTSKFTSASTTFVSKGADAAQHTFNFGVGLDIHAQNNVTVSLDYDLEEKADYSSHAGSIKARFAF